MTELARGAPRARAPHPFCCLRSESAPGRRIQRVCIGELDQLFAQRLELVAGRLWVQHVQGVTPEGGLERYELATPADFAGDQTRRGLGPRDRF